MILGDPRDTSGCMIHACKVLEQKHLSLPVPGNFSSVLLPQENTSGVPRPSSNVPTLSSFQPQSLNVLMISHTSLQSFPSHSGGKIPSHSHVLLRMTFLCVLEWLNEQPVDQGLFYMQTPFSTQDSPEQVLLSVNHIPPPLLPGEKRDNDHDISLKGSFTRRDT